MARATVPAGSTCGQTTDAQRGADDVLRLPFVTDLGQTRPETGTSRHFWMPRCEGLDYAAGCDLGQDYGLQALRYMSDHQLPPLLGWVALDLAGGRLAAGEKGAVIGFFSSFARGATWQARGNMAGIEQAFAERRARLAAYEAAEARAGR